MRILSGIQPSGGMHIGNYLGAVKYWKEMQNEHSALFCVVDLHALTTMTDPKELKKAISEKVIELLAVGINPEKATLFVQSHVKEHTELAWILNTLTPISELERMTQFKDKAKKHKQNINAGLFTYPTLMASDILLYQTEAVPVGKDQAQHLELTRTLAKKFNSKFGKTFKEPETIIPKEGARIMSLTEPTKKMSKSDKEDSYIGLFDEPAVLKKKIAKAREIKDVIVMGNPNWKPALLGLVANTIAEEYKKPVFLWGRDNNDVLKGSCRSDGTINLVNMMELVKDVFVGFGGHAYAGGFSINTDNVHTLGEVLNNIYKEAKKNHENNTEDIFIDKHLEVDDISWNTYSVIEKFAPFGVGNPKPLFMFNSIEIHQISHFGKEKNHLKIEFKKTDGKIISAIAFFKTSESFKVSLEKGDRINLVATMEKSMFRNFPELRLRIVDVI